MEIASQKSKFNFKTFLSKRPVKIISLLLLLAIIGLVIYRSSFIQKKLSSDAQVVQRTSKVERGDIKVTVSGSGAVYFVQSQEAVSKVDGVVKKVYFKAGDKVKAGELLVELDDSDQQEKVQDAENNLAQTQLSNNSTYTDAANLTIKAPFTGQVTGISISKGDSVNKGAAILTITDTSKLKATLPFNASDIKSIKVGSVVDINVTSLMQTVKGTVTYVSNQPTTSSTGALLYNVEIQINNPGALTENMDVSADISTTNGILSSIGAGKLSYVNKSVVTSKVGGTVESILVRENQQVQSGATILKLQSDDVEKSLQTASLNIENSQKQVKSAAEKLEYYKIYAPFDGTIISQDINVEDSLKAGDVIAKIADTAQLAFDVPIDELDVSQIKVGQKVSISLDAFTETAAAPINGEVSKIAMEGTSNNGVTTYNVTVKIIDGYEKIKSGMNANGEILVNNTTDVLYVPIEAIQKRGNKSFVYVKSSGTNGSGVKTENNGTSPAGSFSKDGNMQQGGNMNNNGEAVRNKTNNAENSSTSRTTGNRTSTGTTAAGNNSSSKTTSNYYANAALKEVEVGAYNDDYIEIKSGLNEGDTVILPQIQSSSSKQSTNTQGGMGGLGGIGGGVPGGMPQGGTSQIRVNSGTKSGGSN